MMDWYDGLQAQSPYGVVPGLWLILIQIRALSSKAGYNCITKQWWCYTGPVPIML